MVELWKQINGYEGYYEISDHGNVRSLNRLVTKSNGVSLPIKGKPIAPYLATNYLMVDLKRDAKREKKLVHRLVAEHFVKSEESKEVVHHINSNKLDNHFSNLMWSTIKENNDYAGSQQKMTALKEKPIKARCAKTGVIMNFKSANEAARELNSGQGNIWSAIKSGKKCKGYFFDYADKRRISFFMAMNPPTATSQMQKVKVVNGRPKFYKPDSVKEAQAKLESKLFPNAPKEPFNGALKVVAKWLYKNDGRFKDGQYKTTKGDCDNIQKLLNDSMTRLGFWIDDAQISSLVIEKFWHSVPGIYIEIEEIEEIEKKMML